MATSGDTTYSIDRDTLIKEVLQLIEAIGEGQSPNSTQYSDASRTLNLMLKAWMAYGIQLWKIDTTSFSLTQSKQSYTIGKSGSIDIDNPRPLKILEMVIRDSNNNDVNLIPLTREEYWNLSDRTTEGTPVQFYYDKSIPNGTIYLWPVADSDAATNSTIHIAYQSPIEDMDASTDELDFPQEWYEAVKYGLAVRLAPVYGLDINRYQLLKLMSDEVLQLALSWDTEQESIYFRVDDRGR